MKLAILVGLGIAIMATAGWGGTYHVAGNGNDSNDGSLAAPFRTIQKAAEVMSAGDVCSIHAGTYYESVRPARSGAQGKPLVFTAYQKDEVVVHGGKIVTGWKRRDGNIYETPAPEPVKELFVNGQYMLWARHPNMPFDPVKGFDLQRPTMGTANPPADVDWTGVTVFRAINKEGWWNKVYKTDKYVSMPDNLSSGGWVMGALGLIDSEGEWCWKDGTLYLWPPGGKNPARLRIEAKVRDVGFDLSDREHVILSNLTVFGATINMNGANYCILDGCKALYVGSIFNPAKFHAKPDDNCSPLSTDLAGKGILVNGSHNIIRNCEIAHSWGNCVSLMGSDNIVENCDIHDANWQGWECAALAMNGGGHIIRNNVLHHTQRAALLCTDKFEMVKPAAPSRITLNHIHDTGIAKTDNGGIYCFMTDGNGTVISHNWIHDNYNGYNSKLHSAHGIYLDNYSRNFVVHHNVIWNITHGTHPAGIRANNPQPGYPPNAHQIYNNTIWNCDYAINSPDKDWNGSRGAPYWAKTKVFNNILLKPLTFGPASIGNNYTDQDASFVDAAKYDFRLKKGSQCVDAGKVIPGINDGYAGSAPDVGAYEYGGDNWRPGIRADAPRQSYHK